jgi:TatD DNase family protein
MTLRFSSWTILWLPAHASADYKENKMLFDSHAHYYDKWFEEEIEGGADALLSQLFANDICGIIHVAENIETARLCCDFAERYDKMYAAAGIHPCHASHGADLEGDMTELEALLRDKSKKIVALGEIGFDYHYPDTDRQRQAAYFDAQMSLAEKLGLPVIIHDRDAHADTIEMLRSHPNVKGVLHSFSGSAESAKELVKMGWYISFSGVVTFKNAPKTKEAAKTVPVDRMLYETDCPYLSPVPHRGQLNHSGNLHHTAKVLSEIKEMEYEAFCDKINNNIRRLFGIEVE